MTYKKVYFLIAAVVALLLSSGCGGSGDLPDLVVEGRADNGSFTNSCAYDSGTHMLTLRIANRGRTDAQASTTRFAFTVGAAIDTSTGTIAAGSTNPLGPVTVPNECLGGTCLITVTVDSGGSITESNEDNNVATCEIPG